MVIFFITIAKAELFSFYIFLVFSAASFLTALLQIFHIRNGSHLAIENIFKKLLSQKALGEIEAVKGEID
jgi:hypothetical protein